MVYSGSDVCSMKRAQRLLRAATTRRRSRRSPPAAPPRAAVPSPFHCRTGRRRLRPARHARGASPARLREQIHRNRQVHRALASRVRLRIGALAGRTGSRAAFGGSAAHFTTGRAMPTWSISWNACRSASVRRAAAAHRDQRTPRQVRGRDPGQRIGVPRTARHQRERRPAVNPRPRIGRVRHARFVPHVHDAHARARRRRQHFVQMIAHQREDRVESPTVCIDRTNSSAPFGIEPPCYYNREFVTSTKNSRYRRRRIYRLAHRAPAARAGLRRHRRRRSLARATGTTCPRGRLYELNLLPHRRAHAT